MSEHQEMSQGTWSMLLLASIVFMAVGASAVVYSQFYELPSQILYMAISLGIVGVAIQFLMPLTPLGDSNAE